MSQLAALLKEYFERSEFKSVTDLTQAARAYTPMSRSYVSHMLRGERQKPAYDKLMAIAQALGLDQRDTNRLLAAAGLPSRPSPTSQIERMQQALEQLAQTPGVSGEAVNKVVEGLLQTIEGFRVALGAAAPPEAKAAPSATLRPLPAPLLSLEEGMIDDLLGEILSRGEAHPLDTLFAALKEAAQGERWEVKRRIAEALFRLVQLQPEATMELAAVLRQDYHLDYRADIRRRVVEAVPILYRHRPEAALALLASRERDEVYVAMATVEALHDLQSAGLLTSEVAEQYVQALRLEEPVHQKAIDFLHELLQDTLTAPDATLAKMHENRGHPERMFRICIVRTAPRLLAHRSEPALELLAYFLRRDEAGQPAEHQNLRRPVSKALSEILALIPEATPAIEIRIEEMLRALAEDPDIHVRRALGDALDRLAVVNAELSVVVLDVLIEDDDPYVRQRAWHTLMQLAELQPERATEYYQKLLTPMEP